MLESYIVIYILNFLGFLFSNNIIKITNTYLKEEDKIKFRFEIGYSFILSFLYLFTSVLQIICILTQLMLLLVVIIKEKTKNNLIFNKFKLFFEGR